MVIILEDKVLWIGASGIYYKGLSCLEYRLWKVEHNFLFCFLFFFPDKWDTHSTGVGKESLLLDIMNKT